MKRNLKKILIIVMTLLIIISLYGCGDKRSTLGDYIPYMKDAASLYVYESELYNHNYVEVSEQEKNEIIKYISDIDLDLFQRYQFSSQDTQEDLIHVLVDIEYEESESGEAVDTTPIEFIEQVGGQYILFRDMTPGKAVLKADRGTLDMEEIQSEIEKHIYENCENPDYELDIKIDDNITTFADYLPELKEVERVWLHSNVDYEDIYYHLEPDAQEEVLNTLLSLNLEKLKPYNRFPFHDEIPNSGVVLARVVLGNTNERNSYIIGVVNGEDGLHAYIKDIEGRFLICLKGEKDALDYEALEKKMNGYLK